MIILRSGVATVIISQLIKCTLGISYTSKQQIYLPKNSMQQLKFSFGMRYNDEKIIAKFRIENNWLTTSLPFDIIVTPEIEDADCVMSGDSTCSLSSSIISYTYIKDITLNFTDKIKVNDLGYEYSGQGLVDADEENSGMKYSDLYVILINQDLLSPKAYYQDLKLDTTYTFEVVKENTRWRTLLLFALIGVLLLSGIMYIKTKNMSNEVKIYDKVLEELEIQMNNQRNSAKF